MRIIAIILFIVYFADSPVFGATMKDLSSEQIATAKMVYDFASNITMSDGDTYERTIMKIVMQETSFGKNLIGDFKKGTDVTKASLGLLQFQIQTVKENVRVFPDQLGWIGKKSDSWIAQKLIKDDGFSLMLGAYNWKRLMKDKRRNTYLKLVSGWNGGIVNREYYKNIQKHSKLVDELIRSFKNPLSKK